MFNFLSFKKYLLITPFLFFSFTLFAESPVDSSAPSAPRPFNSGVVTGMVIDDSSNEPLLFASVVLHSVRDSSLVTGAITNEQGVFVIEQVPEGKYYVAINYVGYPRKEFNGIQVTKSEPVYEMGTIRVEPGAALLSEVTVEAARELMEVGLDRRVINVDSELTATGGTALELMQNIPSVAVDFEGNVSLRGSSNVTILVDGRPSSLTGLSGSEALEQIPSNMIERIEVITNPSARYSPDGTSGIINIVLKKERRAGYNGMASLNASTGNRYTGSLNLNYKTGKVNFFGNYSGRIFNMEGSGFNFRTSFLNDTTFLDQDTRFENTMNSHNVSFGADYQFNDFNTLTASVMYNSWQRISDNFTDYNALDINMFLTDFFTRTSGNEMENQGMNYTLNYRKTFDQKLREFNADIVFSTRGMEIAENNLQRFIENNGKPAILPDLLENTSTNGDNWSLSFQTDYIHPLGEDQKLEFGGRAYLREMGSDFNFFNYDPETQEWKNNTGLSNQFVYNEQVYAAYGIYSTMLGKYSLQAGLRLEQTYIEADQRTTNEVYSDNYLNLFPTVHLRRNFEQNQSLQVSYSRRINRPNNRYLNPFVSYTDPYDLSFGNPQLKPELINSMELGYTRFWKNTTINPSLFYRYTDGMITRFRTMDQNGIAYTTFENINRGTSYGAELILSQQLFPWWRANGTFSYYRQIIEGGDAMMEMRTDSYSWSARMVNNLNLGKGWDLQVNGFYRSPVVMLQGEMEAMYSADMGLRKNILDRKGTITLRVSDIFNTQKFRMYNYGDNFTIDMERKRNSRMVFVGFTYRINEYNNRRNQRSREQMDNSPQDFDEFDM
ncbi:MAG: TonB-dependent receptor [Bacteroides sp.]|jgi:outer membrane receptor protein involved in Fe transport|nr:TonB-dependent receptor [Bacteroides sp.]